MELETPQPWDSPNSANAADRDYNIKSPLQSDGSDFPCKGLDQASAKLSASATYQAGQTYNMTVEGYANHNGGSCQISLSYDNGKTWKVIKSMIGGCPGQGGGTWDFTIPMTAPSGTALFAWTWINHTGNREFYMNCAVVDIDGQSGGDLCMLPNLYVANLKGINSCVSPEGIDTMYPHPGTDVLYNNGMSGSSPATGSDACEIPAPACGNSDSPVNEGPPSSPPPFSPPQSSPAEPSPAEPSPAEPSPVEPSPVESSPAESSPPEPSPAQFSPPQSSPPRYPPMQSPQERPSQERPVQERPSQARPPQMQPSQARPPQMQPPQVQPSQAQYPPTRHSPSQFPPFNPASAFRVAQSRSWRPEHVSTPRAAKGPHGPARASRHRAGSHGTGIAGFEISAASGSPGRTSAVEEYMASAMTASAAAATGAEGAALSSQIQGYVSTVLRGRSSAAAPAQVSDAATPNAYPMRTLQVTSRVTSTGVITPTPDSTEASLINSYIESLLTPAPTPPNRPNDSNPTLPSPPENESSPSFPRPGSLLFNMFGEQTAQRRPQDGAVMPTTTSCPPRPVVTQYSTAPPPPASCTAPVLECDCEMPGDYCAPVNDCTTMCVGSATGSSTWRTVVSSTTPSVNTTASASYYSPSPPPPTYSPSPSDRPGYVTTDPNTARYLPCTPGAFLCGSATSFYTCNQPAPPSVPKSLAPNGWAWGWLRPVADGMMCLPFERVANATEPPNANGGTWGVRDDRYVRARPNGDCSEEGVIRCTEGGGEFEMCDHGGWVGMGKVAKGTRCVDGGIVRAAG
ncbi:putative endoglucanase protein [Lasiodiplodia theobromae]|uniref:Uncharacterized protein n=1 Tax=Lasiodiplodia theobromae TaxID=45133 RepID=A0A5N5D4N6_9PEZI|nr:Endoglucanase protein [Lasiodiplodia theobromae]KAB2572571.1 hypothetical protein DBV05_g8808 [Lasiodiplodia theobromae]KAF4536030.1 Endoglucanase protein [Lasiodiplodia theobromae]KAF9633197.1 putative endoglucanase protein [Lasiodiplodia theobromae]